MTPFMKMMRGTTETKIKTYDRVHAEFAYTPKVDGNTITDLFGSRDRTEYKHKEVKGDLVISLPTKNGTKYVLVKIIENHSSIVCIELDANTWTDVKAIMTSTSLSIHNLPDIHSDSFRFGGFMAGEPKSMRSERERLISFFSIYK